MMMARARRLVVGVGIAGLAVGRTAMATSQPVAGGSPPVGRCSGFGPRLRPALTGPFTARTRSGPRVEPPAIVAGAFAGRMIPAATWYPAEHGAISGLEQVASSVAARMTINVCKEFKE